jgi:type IV secretion system protein VirB5
VFRARLIALTILACLAGTGIAHAQFAVIDASAIAQLVQQLTVLEQQLVTLESQLRQAQQEYQSITGDRGMENLLSGTNRNYLPTNWTELLAALAGPSATYPAFSSAAQASLAGNAVLTPAQVASLSTTEQGQLQGQRQAVALLAATVQQALSTTSSRFASLQQLISAIGTAQDAKASLDLQARIGAEQSMVANDATKLQVLYEAAQAQAWAEQQSTREQSVAGIGSLRNLPAMGLGD